MRALDQRLILDLLTIEKRPDAWSGVLDTAIGDIDQLVLVGDLALAAQLLEAIAKVAQGRGGAVPGAGQAGLTKLVEGPMVRHLATFLKQATDAEFGVAKQMCKTIGPVLVKPMSDAIMGEDNPRTVRRLRDILISFGPAAREYANELQNSRNPAVRRAAVDLLRALGGDAALPDLRAMLDDADAAGAARGAARDPAGRHQRGLPDARAALQSGAPHTRDAIMQALGAFRDEKAAPLFVHILNHTDYTGPDRRPSIRRRSNRSAASPPTSDRSPTLKEILYRGEWWAPGAPRASASSAARALRSMGHPSADRVLEEAAASGPGGVRKIAKAALAEPAPARPAARRNQ